MKILTFGCKLLSDVILNQKSASEGPNSTLDFIPGGSILGISAASVYEDETVSEELKGEIFHSGKVRFGDAHPSLDGLRGLRVPASLFYPKMKGLKGGAYVHHRVPDLTAPNIRVLQLKQCRSGFYSIKDRTAVMVNTESNFAIKSAHDKDLRTSKEGQIYGYESLQSGLEMIFSVEIDSEDNQIESIVRASLLGRRRVGRSRSAQYGLIEIYETEPTFIETKDPGDGLVTVYADGRLIFLDADGMPSMQPSAQDLGFDRGEIVWEKSQVRTFCYAPYNYIRHNFDADRCGIEKGSVFVVKTPCAIVRKNTYVGHYRNEGFGAVIYNPLLLDASADGLSVIKFEQNIEKNAISDAPMPKTALSDYLLRQKKNDDAVREAFELTKGWIATNATKFKGERFASQWGSIRKIAMTAKTKDALNLAVSQYLNHGVAADAWNKQGRKETLLEFMRTQLKDTNARITMVNLAAEMAKICTQSR